MEDKMFEEVYNRIRMLVFSPRSGAGSIAREVQDSSYMDKEDLVNELAARFLTRNHKEIRNLSAYVSTFVFREMMNMKRKYVKLID